MIIRTDRLPDAITLGERKILAVESRLVTASGRTVRHIVIFDNHPASLRLLLSTDLTLRRPNEVLFAVLTIVLVLAVAVGMFWPLH